MFTESTHLSSDLSQLNSSNNLWQSGMSVGGNELYNTQTTLSSVGDSELRATSDAIQKVAAAIANTATNLPDFVVGNIKARSVNVNIGEKLVIDYKHQNLGSQPQGSYSQYSYTSFYLSKDTILGSGDKFLTMDRNYTDPSLENFPEVASQTLYSTYNYQPGSYYIIAKADPYNQYNESNETNNIAVSSQKVNLVTSTSQPDLTISNGMSAKLYQYPSTSYMTVNYTINNQGQGTSNTNYTKFYLSKDTNLDSSDVSLSTQGVSDLPGNQSRNQTAYFYLSRDKMMNLSGDYYVIAQADYTNYVSESNENNNITASTNTITVNGTDNLADLTINDGFIVPSSGGDKRLYTFKYTLNNQGDTLAGSTYTHFYLSKDKTLNLSEDKYFGSDYTSRISAETSRSEYAYLYKDYRLDTNSLSGEYYVIAVADGGKNIIESNDNNNVAVSQNTMKFGKPDLSIDDGFTTSTKVSANNYLQVKYTINSEGGTFASPSYTKFYLSKDKTLDKSDTYFGYDYNYGLSGGGSYNKTAYVNVSRYYTRNLESGQYYIIAEADGWNFVNESNENNNLAVSSNTVTFSNWNSGWYWYH